MIADALLSALLNCLLLAGIPFGIYFLVQSRKHGRKLPEIAARAGLTVGESKYVVYCLVPAALTVVALLVWPPDIETVTGEGSAWTDFVGLGIGFNSVLLALTYGVLKTGFPEELLFRGLIAGSLSRRLSLWPANLIQAGIFLAPHLILLAVMPDAWPVLILIFVGALYVGWIRIASGSILGPALFHAIANMTMALIVAAG